MSQDIVNKDEVTALSVIQEIKNNSLDPRSIDKSTRKEVVNLLRLEGYTVQSIAQILKCSDKTIQRTIVESRKENQVASSPEFIKETIGDMIKIAFQHWSSLVRIARNSSATTREKIDAENAAWSVILGCTEELRRLGYLPSATQVVRGTFSHKIDDGQERSWEDIQAEVIELQKIAKETNVLTPDLEQKLLGLGQKIEKANVEEKIKLISTDNQLTKDGAIHVEE